TILFALILTGSFFGCKSPYTKEQSVSPFADQAIVPPPATRSHLSPEPGYAPPSVPAPYPGTDSSSSTPGANPQIPDFAPITSSTTRNIPAGINQPATVGNSGTSPSPYGSVGNLPASITLGQETEPPRLLPAVFRPTTVRQSMETNMISAGSSSSSHQTIDVK
ncbi:MAG TPA: hypothetical protein DEB39_08030, partial [Planctomycetaceae bacterium]|nr:hypothetical protein [Planctomycetaceae bacterium]